jgi:DNA-binding CsgD family transcriptional regulator
VNYFTQIGEMMVERRRQRSDQYQQLFAEIACANEMMEAFPNSDSICERLCPFAYDETVLELEDRLKVEFWRIVEASLTDRQKQVIKLYADGYTQMEIAKKLGINQSSITKAIHGNCQYLPGEGKRTYGGCEKKLKKIVEKDEVIQDILRQLLELREMKW